MDTSEKKQTSSWLEWSKYVLLTLERLDKETASLKKDIHLLSEELKELSANCENLKTLIETKSNKSDIKFLNYKVGLIITVIAFIATMLFNFLLGLIEKQ